MEVRACYEEMGSNFDEVLSRLGSEQMVQRFAIKFLNDKSYEVSSALTEKLRAKELDGTDVMFEKVKEQYDITVNAIRKLQ